MIRRIVSVLLALVLLSGLSACGEKGEKGVIPAETEKPRFSEYADGEELFGAAGSEEEAKKIAELYGIELVSFSQGIATFHTEEDPSTVVKRGKDNGWPLIEVNRLNQAY